MNNIEVVKCQSCGSYLDPRDKYCQNCDTPIWRGYDRIKQRSGKKKYRRKHS